MEQRKNGVHNDVVDAEKENRTITAIVSNNTKHSNRQTLSTIQSKSKATPLNSVVKSLTDGKKFALETNKIDSKPSTEPKLKKLSTSRKSMAKWKRESLTMIVNPLAKKVHPIKCMKGKVTPKLPHQNGANKTLGVPDSSKKTFAVPSDKFPCNFCKKTFFFKTTLEAHKKTHADSNSCKYCHRSFALSTALGKHMRENCMNIPIVERKKLLAANEKSPNLDRTTHRTAQKTPNLMKHSTDELLEFVSRSCSVSQSNQLKAAMEYVPPIRGVYQTPKKLIKCIKCGQNFKHAFLFAAHAEQCCVDS